jgi:hypothetical protein
LIGLQSFAAAGEVPRQPDHQKQDNGAVANYAGYDDQNSKIADTERQHRPNSSAEAHAREHQQIKLSFGSFVTAVLY